MLMKAKVSVVIPIYNVEDKVARCLESILTQSLHDLEIIVVDDGTPDNSMQVVDRYAAGDNRFCVVAHERNRGLMQARKTGYMMAEGDYVLFCDSDDYLPPRAVETFYNEAMRTGADVVSGDLTLVFPVDGQQEVRGSVLRYGSAMIPVYKSLLLDEYHHNLCGKLFRRSLLQDHDYTTIEHFTNGEDGFLFYQVMEHVAKVVHLQKPLYCYVQNDKSSTRFRYGENAIHSICMLNQLRLKLAEKYPEIRRYAQAKVSEVVSSLYARGYDKDANLDKYVVDCSLSGYASPGSVFKYNPLPKACRLFVKRLLA